MKKDKIQDIYIPKNVWGHRILPPAAKLLYGYIAVICKQDGFCVAGNDSLAKSFHVHKISISNWIKYLKKARLFKTKYRGYNRNTRFIFLPNTSINKMRKAIFGYYHPHNNPDKQKH